MQYESPASLPLPDDASRDHSQRVREHLAEMISAAGGQISFAAFVHEVLYAAGLGYYSAGSTKFGREGDFVTAPEVSPVFSRVLARQAGEVLAGLDQPEILEIGAGSGRLAVDVLRAMSATDSLPATYNILEVSPDLEARQRERLGEEVPDLVGRVRWLAELPQTFRGVVVANEVLDALPFERFVRRESGIRQCCVSIGDDGFAWSERPAPERLSAAVLAIESDIGQPLAEGYTSEVCLAASPWIADLAASLQQGAVFLFDYGVARREYYAADRVDGWLRCHFRHHAHSNPLILPGIQDLTTWVDFSSVAGAACDAGLDILGYQAQSQFLLGGGLDREMQGFEDLPVAQQLELSGQIKTLTLPGEMGENFKLMVLGCGDVIIPSALNFADRTASL